MGRPHFTVGAAVETAESPAKITLRVVVTVIGGAVEAETFRGVVTLLGGCAINTTGEGDLAGYLATRNDTDAYELRAAIRRAVLAACIPIPAAERATR